MREKLKDFQAEDLYGEKRSLKEFLGKDLYLVFNRGFA